MVLFYYFNAWFLVSVRRMRLEVGHTVVLLLLSNTLSKVQGWFSANTTELSQYCSVATMHCSDAAVSPLPSISLSINSPTLCVASIFGGPRLSFTIVGHWGRTAALGSDVSDVRRQTSSVLPPCRTATQHLYTDQTLSTTETWKLSINILNATL